MGNSVQISFLITHFNRPADLLKCINAIKDIPISNYEIVVSDDGSTAQNIEIIQSFKIDELILAPINQGLAANINKGLKACKGKYVIYCQEDFVISTAIGTILGECMELLDHKKVDLIRFTSNFRFNKTIPITLNISRIPKFSFQNFLSNYYQYSDHPFIIKRGFHEQFGYYLEATSGRYGETEYAIRILKSKAKIGITNTFMAYLIEDSQSILINESGKVKHRKAIYKPLLKLARALRLYLECLMYNNSKRGLKTYKNFRK